MPGFKLIIIVFIVMLAVFFFKRVGKKGLILIPVIILGIPLLVVTVWHRSENISLLYDRNPEILEQVQEQSAIWSDAIDDYFEADHYATMADAAEYLAHLVVKESKDTKPSTPWVIYGRNAMDSRTLNAFSDVVRMQLNLTDVRTEMAMPDWRPSDSNTIECVLDIPKEDNRTTSVVNGLPINNGTGTIRVRIENNASSPVIRTAEFRRKNWVNTLAELRNQSTSSLMVARSNSSCTDETEAQDQAMSQAVTMVQDLLRKSNQDYTVLDQEITLTPQDLLANLLVADQFSQSLRTSTTRVWRHAVLLHLDPQRMQNLLHQKTRQIQRQHKSWARDLSSLAALALIVLILYIFLNAATKGYYVWSLRVFALITIVGIVVVLLLV